MVDVTGPALSLLRLYGPLALCLFTFLEASMLFPFLPSEVVVPVAAGIIVSDPVSLLVFVVAAAAGGTAGAFVPFYVFGGTRVGEAEWLESHLHVPERYVERGETWFGRWGQSSVLWGRFLPVLRSVVSVPAGVAGMGWVRFGTLTAVGTVGFYAAAGAVVYYGRQRSLFEAAFAAATDRPVLATAALLVAGGVALLARRWLRGRR